MTELVPDRFHSIKKLLNQATHLLGQLGAGNQAPKCVNAYFLLKVLEGLWSEKFNLVFNQTIQDDEPVSAKYSRICKQLDAEFLEIPKGTFTYTTGFDFYIEEGSVLTDTIDDAFKTLEKANPDILAGAFEDVSFSCLLEGIQRRPSTFEDVVNIFKDPLLDFASNVIDRKLLLALYSWICAEIDSLKTHAKVGDPPAEMADLAALLLQPRDGDTIYDPTCGDGRFLIACGQLIRTSCSGSGDYSLFGQDAQTVKAARARVSALIMDENLLDVRIGDFVRAPAFTKDRHCLTKFNVVVAQSALSVDGYGDLVSIDDPFNRFHRGAPPKARGEYALLSHIAESLDEHSGRGLAIFTLGVLFREGAEALIRKQLIEENLIDAVIELPPKLVEGVPYPTVALVLSKFKPTTDILFVKASLDFETGKSQNRLTASAIERMLLAYQNRSEIPLVSRPVGLDLVRANNYNLQINRYLDSGSQPYASYKGPSYAAVRASLMQELNTISSEIDEIVLDLVVSHVF